MTFKPTLPSETFRVYVRPKSRLYFRVHVSTTLKAMRREMRVCSGWSHPRQLAAVDAGIMRRGGRKTGFCGTIWFSRTRLGVGIVAHELTHAALRYFDRRHQSLTGQVRPVAMGRLRQIHAVRASSNEEHFCDVVEYLNIEFWRKAYRLKVTSR